MAQPGRSGMGTVWPASEWVLSARNSNDPARRNEWQTEVDTARSGPDLVRIDGSSVGASRLPSHVQEGLWTVVLTGSMCRPLLESASAQPGQQKARQSYSTPWS